MNTQQIGGLVIGGILALIAAFKLELIKEQVRKLTSGKEKVNNLSYLILFLLFVIPSAAGFVASKDQQESPPPQTQDSPKDSAQKGDIEQVDQLVKDVATGVNETVEEVRKENAEKQKNFEAHRQEKWVYQLGERISGKDDAALYSLYSKVKEVEGLSVFKDGSDLIVFRKVEHSKAELENSLNDFKSQINNAVPVYILDLMSRCTFRKQNFAQRNDWKFGKKKQKAKLECYICN